VPRCNTPLPVTMRRQPGSLLLLAALLVPAAVLVPAALLVPAPAAAQAPSGGDTGGDEPGLPGADVFDMRYYLTDADGNRGRTMDTQDFSYFLNKARCDCGSRIETQIRLKVTAGMSYSQSAQLETFVGTNCAIAEVTPLGQVRPCVQAQVATVPTYINGIIAKFHPLWLTSGVATGSPSRSINSSATVAANSCESGAQGQSGIWMCAPIANGMANCQSDDFFISGNVNSNLGNSDGIQFDFAPPTTVPTSISALPGDSAVVVKWELGQPGDIFGFRVLCEEAGTGKPPPGKGMAAPALDVRSNGTYYFTKDNLCPNGPFSEINISPDAPVATGGTTTTTTDVGTDTDTGDDTGGLDTGLDTGGTDTDTGGGGEVRCGDGQVSGDEACDDGNVVDHDDCRNDCTEPVCGDGIRSTGMKFMEACDQGANNGPNSLCLAGCTLGPTSVCGNNMVEVGEGCDDNGPDCIKSCDGMGPDCLTCRLTTCGNGVIDPPEVCDDPADPGCSPRCTTTVCGDGLISPGEACDDGANNSDAGACTSTCTLATCGDGKIRSDETDMLLLEECDDGANNGDDKACLTTCVRNACGDGNVSPDEECDDGADNGDDKACLTTCVANTCGDGKLGPDEQCDNGADNGDGKLCTSDCKRQSSEGMQNLEWAYVCSGHLSQQTRTARIEGLENGKAYNFMLVMYDRAGNPAAYPEIITTTPLDTRDLWEQCKAQGDVCGESGFCNVAGRGDRLLALGGLIGLGLGLGGLLRRSRRKRA
jgi:cysteine-rich repeat protein